MEPASPSSCLADHMLQVLGGHLCTVHICCKEDNKSEGAEDIVDACCGTGDEHLAAYDLLHVTCDETTHCWEIRGLHVVLRSSKLCRCSVNLEHCTRITTTSVVLKHLVFTNGQGYICRH